MTASRQDFGTQSVWIIEDNVSYSRFLSNLLRSKGAEVKTDDSPSEALAADYDFEAIETILLDIYFPEDNSIGYIPKLLQICPNAEIIINTVSEQYTDLMRAFRQGATGYMLKSYKEEEVLEGIETFRKSGAFISPYMAKRLIDEIRGQSSSDLKFKRLSDKDKEVLQLLSMDYSYKQVAEKLDLSIDGVRTRIKSVYKKLNVNSKLAAVNYYLNIKK